MDRARRFYVRARKDLAELPSPATGQAVRVRTKLLQALVALGRADDVEQLAREIEAEDKDARFSFGGAVVKREALVAMALKQRASLSGEAKGTRADYVQPRGDAANRAAVARPAKIGAARFAPRAFDTNRYDISLRPDDPTAPRHLPLIFGDSIFLTTAERLRVRRLADGEEPRPIPRPHVAPQFNDENSKALFSGVIDRGVHVTSYIERVQDEQSYRGIPIKVRIPFRKLAAFDTDRWRWRWNHREALESHPKLGRGSFPAPPVASEGVIFAPAWAIEGYVHCYATAFDVETGALKWCTWLASGQVEQTMFGELAREPLSLPLAVSDGTVFDVTCFGAVVALDQETGRPRWVTEYDQIPISAAKGYFPDHRTLPWESNPPVVENGVLIIAPLDSRYYYGIDVATGSLLWSYETKQFDREAVRLVLGADQGKVILAGPSQVLCRDVKTGKLVWQQALSRGQLAGRGVIAGGKVLVPVGPSDVITYDLASGTKESSKAVTVSGNLAVSGDSIVITGDNQFSTFQADTTESSKSSRDF